MIAAVQPTFRKTNGPEMAKKRPVQPATDPDSQNRKPRMQNVLVADLRKQIARSRVCLSDIEACLTEADAHKLPSIEIDGANKFERAITLLVEFSDHVVRGVRKGKRGNTDGPEIEL